MKLDNLTNIPISGGGFTPPSNAVEETYTVLAGKSVEAGDFVQTMSLTGINNLNPSGTTLIDLRQVSTGKYAVLYYDSVGNTYLKICEIDSSNNIVNEGSAVSVDAYTVEDAIYSSIIVFSATRIGITYRAQNYVKFDYYSVDDVSLSLNYSHNIYTFNSSYSYYNRGVLGCGLIGENKIITLYTYYGSNGNSAYVYGTVTNVSENSADSTNVVGGMDYSRTNMIYNDSTITFSARYKGKPNIFVNSNNEVIIAMINDSYFYYDVCTIDNKTITFLNKVSASSIGTISMASGEYYGGAMNQPIMVNNYLIVYSTIRSSTSMYGVIRSRSYDNENKVFTSASAYQDDEYYSYGRIVPVNSNQFMAIRFRENTSYALNYQNTTYALYTVDNDGTITRTHKLSLLSNTTAYSFASLFPLSTDSVYTSLAGINICYKTTGNQIMNSPLVAKTYIIPANNNTHELMIAKESKTQGQSCVVYRLRTYWQVNSAVTNGTLSDNKVYINGTTKITITPDTGYDLPSSVNVTGATNSYDSTTGVITLSNPTGNVTITATCEELSGYTVTLHLSGSTYEYGLPTNTFTVDGVEYHLYGSVGSWSTDYPYNDTPVTASTVVLTSQGCRWKDSDNASWTELGYDATKTWNIPRNNFEIWIDTQMDE